MVELFSKLVKYCDDFIRDHPFLSVIAFGVLTNLLTDIVKSAFAKSVTGSVIISKIISSKLLDRGIKGYELQLEEIKSYRENPLEVISRYLSYLYQNFVYFVFIATALYILLNFFNDIVHVYSFYGASVAMIFRIVIGTVVYSTALDNLLYHIDKYENKTRKILERLRSQREYRSIGEKTNASP